jgi:hypothetical protein
MQIQVTIEGVTPLLMNRFADAAEVAIASGHRPTFQSGSKGTPREQAALTAYRDEETGELYVPGPNIFAALVEAGKFHKLGKSRVTTQKSSLIPAGLLVSQVAVPLSTKDFDVDSRRVRIPATGGCVMRHRARVDRWTATFSLDVDPTMFSPQFVRTLVDDAGKKIGLGDYRPATRGPFGRFVVRGWKVEA